MDDAIELARQLGKAINNSPQAAKLRAAREELAKNADASKLLGEYQAQTEKIARLEEEKKLVEVEDKHKLRNLHDKLVSSESFKKFTAAQVDYVDLMRQVNDTLRRQLAETEAE